MVLVRPDIAESAPGVEGNRVNVNVKTPKRVLHFCDGVLEEYSSDEEDNVDKQREESLVDPKTLTWGPWFWYKAWLAGTSTLSLMDTMGEYLAAFFGITTPRYYFELEEYKRREEHQKVQDEHEKNWPHQPGNSEVLLKEITASQPKPSVV